MKYLVLAVLVFISGSIQAQNWQNDYLGDGFEFRIVKQKDDYEGEVVSAIIRKQNPDSAISQAVLYVHGFNDYFFQKELADTVVNWGYHFYAVDLRKYGRAYLSHQKLTNVRDIQEYYADIDSAFAQIKRDSIKSVVFVGHSTGGLIVSLYAEDHPEQHLIQSIMLNSPFFDMNLSGFEEAVSVPVGSFLGDYYPDKVLVKKDLDLYGKSIHKDFKGEWEFNTDWKPIYAVNPNLGWVRAIHLGHERVQSGLHISKPILVLHSDKSVYSEVWTNDFFTGDGVLDVKDIDKYSSVLGDHVTKIEVKDAIHDVILSKLPVRLEAYRHMRNWLKEINK
ncbi:alpha/beta hydrolase [bacterium]|nr:MAG: alpha/beta hydrolase [bacterium]